MIRFSEQDSDLAARKWFVTQGGYAAASVRVDGRKTTQLAHRVVLSRMARRALLGREYTDHINFDRLDNRRENLRIATPQENSRHRQPMNALGMRGVTWDRGAWKASVQYIYCGRYATPEEAARAAYLKRRELGYPNEPEVPEAPCMTVRRKNVAQHAAEVLRETGCTRICATDFALLQKVAERYGSGSGWTPLRVINAIDVAHQGVFIKESVLSNHRRVRCFVLAEAAG